MPISLTIDAETPEGLMADIRTLFPSALPPMQEQPRENREPLPAENVKEIEPPKRTRKTKEKEDAKAPEGESDAASQSANSTASETDASKSSSTASESTGAPSPSGETIPDIEDLRARLKTLGATEGFGHDKVFEVLGKYGAKNASTVPEEKRADCIAEIDALLKGGK
jgi:hypothetical protein